LPDQLGDIDLQTNLAIAVFMGKGVEEKDIAEKLDALQDAYQLDRIPSTCWKRLKTVVKAMYPEPSMGAVPQPLQVSSAGQPSWLWGLGELQRTLVAALEAIQDVPCSTSDSVCIATATWHRGALQISKRMCLH
jgi:hypothetical protein